MITISTLAQRALVSLQTVPTASGWAKVAEITCSTTVACGLVSVAKNLNPPAASNMFKPASAFLFPGLVEELFWRGALLPPPALLVTNPTHYRSYYLIVLCLHVASHPIAAATVWPRGQQVFGDGRFLLLATIVLGGATISYIVSGGSVWAAAITHGVPVALWRDFFSGGKRLISAERKHSPHSGESESIPSKDL
jgi:predicted Abi (CAAX) family protease